MAFENMSGAEKGFWGIIGVAGIAAVAVVSDYTDPFEKTKDNAVTFDSELGDPVVEVPGTGLSLDFSSVPGLTCTGPVQPITVDARADIGTTTSLLKAIEINRPGSQATEMNSSTVYALARTVAALNGHPELVSPTQLDDFPAGTYNIPTGCTATSTDGSTIIAIT